MISRMRFQKKGYVLIYVVLAVVLSAILATSLFNMVFLTTKLFMQIQYSEQAYCNTVAGVEYGIYMVKSATHYDLTNPTSTPINVTSWPPLTLPGGSATILIQRFGAAAPYTYSVTSTGTATGATPAITKTIIANCTDTGSITSWQ